MFFIFFYASQAELSVNVYYCWLHAEITVKIGMISVKVRTLPFYLFTLVTSIQSTLALAPRQHLHSSSTHQLALQDTHEFLAAGGGFGNGGNIFVGYVLSPLLFLCALVCIWYN
jgi:hypothetical protein